MQDGQPQYHYFENVAAANAKFLAFIEGLPSLQRPEHLKTIVASSAESINKNIIAMTSEGETIYGLDIEWQPQFQKGAKENKTALIQICNSKTVLLMQVHRLKYLPTALTQFLRERRFLKSGVNIRGDGLKLARDFGVECNGFIDLGTVCKHIYPHETRMSLRALTGSYLGYKMDKKKKVILSNWSSFRLSQAQIKYASLDAYASYKLSAVFCEALKKLGTGSEHFVMASIAIEKDAAKESDKNHRGVSMKPNTPSPQGTHNNTRSAHHYHPKSTTTIIKRTDSQAEKASV
ncbi:ribonuclease H-like domain-containing protein [Dichotomocladium elegans]|nr:ribonuclease H-like domain-containing protein [Dichotomocladium elegans]